MRINEKNGLLSIVCMLGMLGFALTAFAADPAGYFDSITNRDVVTGEAHDPDTPNQAADVHLYYDGDPSSGRFMGSTTANLSRGAEGFHGFSYSIPGYLKDGNSHAIYGYAINTGAGSNTALANSPQLFKGEKTEVWTTFFTSGNISIFDLGTSTGWPFVRQNIDVLQIFAGQIGQATQQQLIDFAAMVKKYNIKVSVEAGGLYDWFAPDGNLAGEHSWAYEYSLLKKYTDPVSQGGAGGTIDYLNLDGPIRRMLYPFDAIN